MLSGRLLPALSVFAALASVATGQCVPGWSAEFEPGDPDGMIDAMAWFDDGGGMRLYASGSFRTIGGVLTGGAARWDGKTWEGLNLTESVTKFRVLPDEKGSARLYALGDLGPDDDLPVAVWNGTTFEFLPPTPFAVTAANDAVRFDADGDGPSPSLLLVGGYFWEGSTNVKVAAWDGTQWTMVTTPASMNTVEAIEVFDPDGAGPALAYAVAAANLGTQRFWKYTGPVEAGGSGVFEAMSGRVANTNIRTLAVLDLDGPAGNPARLFAFGQTSSQASVLASFDGASWTEVNPGTVVGNVRFAGMWDRDGDGPLAPVVAMVGSLRRSPETDLFNVATWSGSGPFELEHPEMVFRSGAALPPGTPDSAGLPSFALGMRGGVHTPGGEPRTRLEVYEDRWVQLGAPPSGAPNAWSSTLLSWDPDGPGPVTPNLLLRGPSSIGTEYIPSFIVRGSAVPGGGWGSIPPPIGTLVSLDVVDPDADGPAGEELWATVRESGVTSIRRWTGSEWTILPGTSATTSYGVNAIDAVDIDGAGPLGVQVVVAGQFTSIGGVAATNIARYDGVTFHPIGPGLSSPVENLAVVDLDGDGPEPALLFAECQGSLPPIGGVGYWSGSKWTRPAGMSFAAINDMLPFDPDGPGPATPRLMLSGSIRMLDGTLRTMASWDGETFTQLPGYPTSNWIGSLAVFDEDGPDGPGLASLFTFGIQAPFVRRVTDIGWDPLEDGDVDLRNDPFPIVTVCDEDGPGPNPGGLYITGQFTRAGDTPSGFLARWGCPLGPVCTADWDGNGVVNSTDVSEFINDWFTDQAEGTLVTDWDGNGVVNSTDVSDFINAWFEQSAKGCG